MRSLKLIAPALVATAVLATAPAALAGGGERTNLVETAVAAGQFDTLTELVTEAGLADTLDGPGVFTVFAPTDKAFSKVPAETLQALRDDPEQLRRVLLYHVTKGRKAARNVIRRKSIKTLAGPRLKVNVNRKGTVRVGGAKVTQTNIRATNGIIHVINRVLIPPAS